jgi:hypothetical protein
LYDSFELGMMKITPIDDVIAEFQEEKTREDTPTEIFPKKLQELENFMIDEWHIDVMERKDSDMNCEKELPDTLHGLLRIALEDLELVEKDPNYKVVMSVWHTSYDSSCAVCLAGSVLAKTCNFPRTRSYIHLGEPASTFKNKLAAIDWLRVGEIGIAFNFLYEKALQYPLPFSKWVYGNDTYYGDENWWPMMLDILAILETEGI